MMLGSNKLSQLSSGAFLRDARRKWGSTTKKNENIVTEMLKN
jgi:hypothetical protein